MKSARPSWRMTPQLVLVLLLILEVVVFAPISRNFLTHNNAFEVLRLSVEIGLLALALTPLIVSGGIDLSVGSLMGLSAILFGKLWRDANLPIGLAAALTLVIGAVAGSLNGQLVTRLRMPSLIVTLGTMSLFRGLAEGITGGSDTFTHFPSSFKFLGQGYFFGIIPAQLPALVVGAMIFGVLLHKSTIGRGLVAVGFSPEGARYAGIPVERRIRLVFTLTGLVSSLAAIIYVARLGQAKASAGTGYELLAITAVVLGGTSIFGGRGTIHGTLLGLFAVAVLKNGLQLADLPAELAGVLTGALLLVAIGLDRRTSTSTASIRPTAHEQDLNGSFQVKNSQVALICLAILAGALVIAGSNYLMVRTLQKERSDQAGGLLEGLPTIAPKAAPRQVTVAMMPKSKGNAYFVACRKGAEDAARELGVTLLWDGPTDPDPARQNEVVDTWITRGVDVIAVAVENREGISSALQKARAKGIKVITWDADAEPDARDFFVNQATPEGIGQSLMDNAARVLGGKGEFAIITASLTAGNMIEWQKQIEAHRAAKYPNIKMAALRPCDDLQKKAFDEANTILTAFPNVKLIMAICTPAVPGSAEAVKQAGRTDVKVIGLGLPNENKSYVHEGITDCIVLWNTEQLGYLTVYAAHDLVEGTLKPGDKEITAGKLGKMEIKGDNILLGKPFTFTKENIDGFDF